MKLRKAVVETFLNLKMTVYSVLINIYIYIYIYILNTYTEGEKNREKERVCGYVVGRNLFR